MNRPSQYNNRKPIHVEASDQEEEVVHSVETRQVGLTKMIRTQGKKKTLQALKQRISKNCRMKNLYRR
jgi:hypothetical protein